MFKNTDIAIPAIASSAQEITKDITLAKLYIGFKSILRNIYFDTDKATLKPESHEELNKLERMLKENNYL